MKKIQTLIAAILLVIPQLVTAAIPVNRVSGDLLNLDFNVFVAARPINLILVEKDYQRLRVLRHDGRIKVVAEYFAATGESFGPKETEGDSRTPEGVYFITKRYTDSKVTVFGTRAFHLNYPNVFDVDDGRDGNGIYIHGTNKKLRSNSTNGCVTLNNTDLDSLAEFLNVGSTPVIVVSSLLKLTPGKGVYPDLIKDDFALAKTMLVPEGKDSVEFASLFLVRVDGQTVVGGEHRPGKAARRPVFSAAYLDVSREEGWYVRDRIPDVPEHAEQVAADDESQATEDISGRDAQTFLQTVDWRNLWQPAQENDYLSWYRDSIQFEIKLDPGTVAKAKVLEANDSGGSENETISSRRSRSSESFSEDAAVQERRPGWPGEYYGILLLAVCFGAGSALFFVRSQRLKNEALIYGSQFEINDESSAVTHLDSTEQIGSLRRDILNAQQTLQMLRESKHVEAERMDSHDLEAKLEDLAGVLSEKQDEIEQLTTEKAALKLKGMSHMSGQIEELGHLRQELQAAEEKLEEAGKELGRIAVLEGMVTDQKSQMQELMAEKISMKLQASEDPDRESEMKGLHVKIQDLEETLRTEAEQRQAAEDELNQLTGVAKDLASLRAEVMELRAKNNALKGAAGSSQFEEDRGGVHAQLTEYQDELDRVKENNAALSDELSRMSGVKDELESKVREIDRLAAENNSLQAAAGRSEEDQDQAAGLQRQLDTYQEELLVAQERNDQLANQLDRMRKLEELVLARQVEVKNLTNEIQVQQEKAQLEREQIVADREMWMDSIKSDLETEKSSRQTAEQQVHEKDRDIGVLQYEVAQLKASLSEFEDKLRISSVAEAVPAVEVPPVVPIQTLTVSEPEPKTIPVSEVVTEAIPAAPEPTLVSTLEVAPEAVEPAVEKERVVLPAETAAPAAPTLGAAYGSRFLPDDIMNNWIKS